MEIVRTESLSKCYGTGETMVRAVDDVSLSIEKGSFTAVIGASGSGKSTLLHLLGGVDRPSGGKVFIDGTDLFSLGDDRLAVFRRRQIGLVYQFYNLLPVLTARENVLLPLLLDGREVTDEEADEVLRLLGLSDRADFFPDSLSGGQQQRVAIGRAMMTRPALLLADEPTGNLDRKASDEVMELLRRANDEYGQTIVLITHDLEIAKTADRVITIADGRVIGDSNGTVETVGGRR